MTRTSRPEAAKHWNLAPHVTLLNHGSFGACPAVVQEAQREARDEMEREPLRFFIRELEGRLDAARAELARVIGADPEDVAFVPNATHAVNTVLRSLDLIPGDELLTTNHAYAACRNAMDFVAERRGASVVVADVPFPLSSPEQVLHALLSRVTARTRFALVDHVTSPTALVFPVRAIVAALAERGIDTMIDGAHAPGLVDVDLRGLGAAYYTANCHKWLCGPKGTALLHVRRDRQAGIRPLSISHGARSPRKDRSRFLLEFDWQGTFDPSGYLALPAAIRFLEGLVPGGLASLREQNRTLALRARDLLCAALGIAPPAPDEMLAAKISLPLPDAREPSVPPLGLDRLQLELLERHGIEVPVSFWPAWPRRLLRVTAQVYNQPANYEALAAALPELLAPERGSSRRGAG